MIRDAQLLLRLYWRLDRRQAHDLPFVARLVGITLGIGLISFSAVLGYGAGLFATASDAPFTLATDTVPGLLLTLLLFSLLFSGFNQALRALFLTGDMERLIVAPVRTPAVMAAKLLSRMPSMIKLTLLAVTPALIAYGVAIGAGALYYGSGLLLVLGAPLFGLATGALLAMLLVRVFPLRRLNEYVSAAYIVMGMAVALGIQLPMIMYGRRQTHFDAQTLATLENTLTSLEKFPLPTVWAGRGMVALGQGQLSHGTDLLAYLLLTFGLFAVTVMVASRLYLSGWLRMQGASVKQQGAIDKPGLLSRRSLDSALALKDWLQRTRDSRQVATLFSQFAGAAIVFYVLLRPRADGDGLLTLTEGLGPGTRFLWVLAFASPGVVLSGATLFAGWLIFANAARTSLALEQRSFYILKAAPISPLQVWRGKTLGILAPYTLLVTVLLVGLWFFRSFSIAWLPYAWLCLIIIGWGMLAFMTAMGFPWVNLDWEDPRRMDTRRGNLYSTFGALFYALVACILATLTFGLSLRWPAGTPVFVILGLGLLIAVTVLVVGWAVRRAQQAWSSLGETAPSVPSGKRSRRSWFSVGEKT